MTQDSAVLETALRDEYQRQGFFILEGVVDDAAVAAIKADIARISEKEGRAHTYFDRSGKLRRLEKFTAESESVGAANRRILALLQDVFGQRHVLFKDKYNFKPPAGEGFFAHYDGVFKFLGADGAEHDGWYEYTDDFVNALVALDDFTPDNGPLEVAPWHNDGFETLFQRTKQNGTPDLTEAEEAKCNFKPILIRKGGVVVFSNRCPHRSKKNLSDASRGSLYLTYNAAAMGDFYDAYFRDKSASQNKTSKSLSGEV